MVFPNSNCPKDSEAGRNIAGRGALHMPKGLRSSPIDLGTILLEQQS